MALLGKGVHLLKGTATFGLYGIGIVIGVGVAMSLAKQSAQGCVALRDRYRAKKSQREDMTDAAISSEEINVDIKDVQVAAPTLQEITPPVTKKSIKKEAASTPKKEKSTTPSAKWSRAQLYDRAKELGIAGRSAMNKQQLLKALLSQTSPVAS